MHLVNDECVRDLRAHYDATLRMGAHSYQIHLIQKSRKYIYQMKLAINYCTHANVTALLDRCAQWCTDLPALPTSNAHNSQYIF